MTPRAKELAKVEIASGGRDVFLKVGPQAVEWCGRNEEKEKRLMEIANLINIGISEHGKYLEGKP